MKHAAFIGPVAGLLVFTACKAQSYTHIVTTEAERWIEQTAEAPQSGPTLSLVVDTLQKRQKMSGFGACFNELGWTSLSLHTEKERDAIMEELFAPGKGASFNLCRMPVAANDFARNWYSYNEVKNDFHMYNFSIDNDRATLIPFIKNAQKYNPDLEIWASPWSPPSWLKRNEHYAAYPCAEDCPEAYRNGLLPEQQGFEGTDMLIMEPEYLKAYALYFKKFIEAYRQEGIDIFAVMPQNEFNSAKTYPSCCWTAQGLATFIGDYLGPALEGSGVEIMMGTIERPNPLLVDTVLTHPTASRYVKGAAFQWAGREAIGDIHKRYPDLTLFQSEQECGDGKNDWKGTVHSWKQLKHYIDHGVCAYDYWNISLLQGGISRWGWAQNSLIIVNPQERTYEYSLEYYLMKHISHFVRKGAYNLSLQGDAAGHSLAFLNPDGSLVILIAETSGKEQRLHLRTGTREYVISLNSNSINTLQFHPQ